MHESSFKEMKLFSEVLPKDKRLSICDLGSCDLNGSYKCLFENHDYMGVDITYGKNVDVITDALYQFPFEDCHFDVVVSGQTIEHVEDVYAWVREIARVVKVEGLVCLIGPVLWGQHSYPIDCWRVLPDGMHFLLSKIAKLQVINVHSNGTDCVGIARKE